MMDGNTRVSCTEHGTMLASSLYHLYTQAALLDVRLVCDDVPIYAHKAVLAAGSKFFQERLQSLGPGMAELQMSSINLGLLISPGEAAPRRATSIAVGGDNKVFGHKEKNEIIVIAGQHLPCGCLPRPGTRQGVCPVPQWAAPGCVL